VGEFSVCGGGQKRDARQQAQGGFRKVIH